MAEYIERNALLKKLQERDLCLCVSEADIKELPAANVAPVVHGQWDDSGTGIIICSECGSGYNLIARYTHYCPNCGATMYKEAHDEQ